MHSHMRMVRMVSRMCSVAVFLGNGQYCVLVEVAAMVFTHMIHWFRKEK